MPEVQCINKTPRNDPWDRIRRFGGPGGQNGGWWYLDHAAMIAAIKNNTYGVFYVERPAGHRVNCIVARHSGHEYVKTEADGEHPNNLLSLPECR
jgi:hypothetical protein